MSGEVKVDGDVNDGGDVSKHFEKQPRVPFGWLGTHKFFEIAEVQINEPSSLACRGLDTVVARFVLTLFFGKPCDKERRADMEGGFRG
jgi:hypothetical protein